MGSTMLLAAGVLALCGVALALRAPLDKPNVVMFFVDDLGYGDLGFTGHPTTSTPNIDKLAYNGKILTTWYSGCPVCSGSRAALMTGRQFSRIGVPGVFGPTVDVGLPLNETTVADQMRKAGYATAACGKWHLGQRPMFLPAARGFDHYLGIPYSDDMGEARATACSAAEAKKSPFLEEVDAREQLDSVRRQYADSGYAPTEDKAGWGQSDPAGSFLPLVSQETQANGSVVTKVLEQPLDFTHLAEKYEAFVTDFITTKANESFFLYLPFSHVHTTAGNQPEKQYAGCDFKNTTRRGMFGDALAEADWIISQVVKTLEDNGLDKNTLILFASDNGPWMIQGKSGGSEGLFTGRSSGYWNTGKGCTWDGGVHEPAFAYFPGVIDPQTRNAEVISSLDLLPTLSSLVGVPLPTDRVYDGRDQTGLLFHDHKSAHDFLFFYGGCNGGRTPSAVRYGKWKAHWCTGPGLGGCPGCEHVKYDPPLLFNMEEDPSEAYPLVNGSIPAEYAPVMAAINTAYEHELATYSQGKLVAPPAVPGEVPGEWGVCCDRNKGCDCDGKPSN